MPMNRSVRSTIYKEPEVPAVATVTVNDDPSDPKAVAVASEVASAVEQPVHAFTAEPVVEPVVTPELRFEFQPTDALGRPLGGKQVIKYHTPDELPQKLVEQNVELVRKLREVTRKQTLGIEDDMKVPDDAQRFESFEEFTPRELAGGQQ